MTSYRSPRETIREGQSMPVKELARHLNVCTASVYNGIKKGQIRSIRIGGILRVPADESARLLGIEVMERMSSDLSALAA